MTTNLCIETCYRSLNKHNEELCGDRVQIARSDDSTILVLSDGLGSGVKANILSTLTSKIISTMIKNGASIEDTVETIAHTLPVCKERGLAYSTFMILSITKDGDGYLVEYDNPPCVWLREGKRIEFDYTEKSIQGKDIRECHFKAEAGDKFIIVSDGVTQAGMGKTLSFGWGWDALVTYLEEEETNYLTPPKLIYKILEMCKELYLGYPGDDTTVSVLHIMKPVKVALFSGPPKNKDDDKKIVQDYMNERGIHIVAGGSSAEILARELNKEIEVDLTYVKSEVPPTAKIDGIDLVTEGVLTLKATLHIIKKYAKNPTDKELLERLEQNDGASLLSKILLEECTTLNLYVGRAINPAHNNADFPSDLRNKIYILDSIANSLRELGKEVKTYYY
ncbi:MAG: SpoIIE family protein phosphatase [Synergistaceae bacterium]